MSLVETDINLSDIFEEVMPALAEKYGIRRWVLSEKSFICDMAGSSLYSWDDFKLALITELATRGITTDMFEFGLGCTRTLEARRKIKPKRFCF